VFVAGAASGAKDIADSIVHARAAAAQVAARLDQVEDVAAADRDGAGVSDEAIDHHHTGRGRPRAAAGLASTSAAAAGTCSDYVDVEKVVDGIKDNGDVVVSRTTMFACSEASRAGHRGGGRQSERPRRAGRSVISPNYHAYTFRGVAQRAGPRRYGTPRSTSASSARGSTPTTRRAPPAKATALVAAEAISQTRTPSRSSRWWWTRFPHTLVIGGGIAGLRAAIGLADVGLRVALRQARAHPRRLGQDARRHVPARQGRRQAHRGVGHRREGEASRSRCSPAPRWWARAAASATTGSASTWAARAPGPSRWLSARSSWPPASTATQGDGELGFGTEGVVTLPEFEAMVDTASGPLAGRADQYRGASRTSTRRQPQHRGLRTTGTARGSAARPRPDHGPGVGLDRGVARQFHLYRDMRTYGKFEPLYTEARDAGSVFLKFERRSRRRLRWARTASSRSRCATCSPSGQSFALPVDLVVLVTGMVPRGNDELISVLKLPKGADGFFNEIHPKLRPVETVVDRVLIAEAYQGRGPRPRP